MANLRANFAVFANNQKQAPLCYGSTWKGLISTAGFSDSGADFGNTYYNDHHYHYGYFVYAAALLGHISIPRGLLHRMSIISAPWFEMSQIQVANTGIFQSFALLTGFVGHSWSKGIFFSGDGKDAESSSEDCNFAYGMKLWGLVANNPTMQARGDLMLAVQRQ